MMSIILSVPTLLMSELLKYQVKKDLANPLTTSSLDADRHTSMNGALGMRTVWGGAKDLMVLLDAWDRGSPMAGLLGPVPSAVVMILHYNMAERDKVYTPATVCRVFSASYPSALNFAPLGVVVGWLLLNEWHGVGASAKGRTLFLNHNRRGYNNHYEAINLQL